MRSPTRATSSSPRPARRSTTPSSACRSSSAARRSASSSCRRSGGGSSRRTRSAFSARSRAATGQENDLSSLGVPLAERGTAIGVLVVQTLRRRKFSPNEIRILRAIASQVGGIIAQARLLEDLRSKEKERRDYRRRMVAAIKRLQAYEKTSGRAESAAQRPGRSRLHGLPAAPG